MLGLFVRIALLAAVALVSPLAALWALDAIGVAPMRETIASMMRWEGIAVVSVSALAFWAVEWAFSRAKRN